MIPKIIHQLSKTEELSARQRQIRESWQRHNPDFEYRLWTDHLIEEFLDAKFPEWVEVYKSYEKSICRVDLARYLILSHFGGVYADLDYECLRPINRILALKRLVVGLEPTEHLQTDRMFRQSGLQRMIGNAFIASERGHPFWPVLFAKLKISRAAKNVLDSTGPFIFTRAFDSYTSGGISVLRSEILYPLTKNDCWSGRHLDLKFFTSKTSWAFGCHYWEGSWFRRSMSDDQLMLADIPIKMTGKRQSSELRPVTFDPSNLPLVSCLMVTRGNPEFVRNAINNFLMQTYLNKELVVVTEVEQEPLAGIIAEYGLAPIRWVFVPKSEGIKLGDLRNISVDNARGEYICQWDDDDFSDPLRIEIQHAVAAGTGATATFLERWLVWWPERRDFFISNRRTWEGTIFCRRDAMPRYPALGKGEDTDVVDQLQQSFPIAMLDIPRLYLYVVHGSNTWHEAHFSEQSRRATHRFASDRYDIALNEANKRLQFLAGSTAREHSQTSSVGVSSETKTTKLPARRSQPNPKLPSVLILSPMKNCRSHLNTYFKLLEALDYPRKLLSLGILEGDSTDGTWAALKNQADNHRHLFRNISISQFHLNRQFNVPRWTKEIQLARRAGIAIARNRLLMQVLESQDYVLWLDADLVSYKSDLLRNLLEAGKSIVVPHCILNDGSTFDKNSFCFVPNRETAEKQEYLHDGLYQPPAGAGRRYLCAFQEEKLVRLDAVGGTALLIDSNLHRNGLNFPSFSYRGYIETEGLAAMAADMGITSWGMPQVKITHVSN